MHLPHFFSIASLLMLSCVLSPLDLLHAQPRAEAVVVDETAEVAAVLQEPAFSGPITDLRRRADLRMRYHGVESPDALGYFFWDVEGVDDSRGDQRPIPESEISRALNGWRGNRTLALITLDRMAQRYPPFFLQEKTDQMTSALTGAGFQRVVYVFDRGPNSIVYLDSANEL